MHTAAGMVIPSVHYFAGKFHAVLVPAVVWLAAPPVSEINAGPVRPLPLSLLVSVMQTHPGLLTRMQSGYKLLLLARMHTDQLSAQALTLTASARPTSALVDREVAVTLKQCPA